MSRASHSANGKDQQNNSTVRPAVPAARTTTGKDPTMTTEDLTQERDSYWQAHLRADPCNPGESNIERALQIEAILLLRELAAALNNDAARLETAPDHKDATR